VAYMGTQNAIRDNHTWPEIRTTSQTRDIHVWHGIVATSQTRDIHVWHGTVQRVRLVIFNFGTKFSSRVRLVKVVQGVNCCNVH
jgi:hypothetical protein